MSCCSVWSNGCKYLGLSCETCFGSWRLVFKSSVASISSSSLQAVALTLGLHVD